MWVFDGLSCQNKRSSNMDRLMVGMRRIENRQVLLAVVCDGVGSAVDGEKAANMTVQMLADWFDAIETVSRIGLELMGRVRIISDYIAQIMNGTERRAATTVSALLLLDEYYYLVHAGDSRVYVFDGGRARQLTTDQAENGKLTQYVGQSEPLLPQYEEGALGGGVILLCTDGVFKRIAPDELADLLKKVKPKSIRKTMENVIDLAVRRGESDNITLAIVMKER